MGTTGEASVKQNWTLAKGTLSLVIYASEPLHSDAVAELGDVVHAIEHFVEKWGPGKPVISTERFPL
jgi:hypothetical protein